MPTEVVSRIAPSGGDYVSLQAWELARRGDITAAGRDTIEIAEIEGGFNSITTAEFKIQASLWTTDATNYIVIRAASGHEYDGKGVFNTSQAYLLKENGGTNSYCCRTEEYTRFENIQMVHTNGGPNSHVVFGQLGGGNVTMDGCLLRHEASTTAGNYEGCVVEFRSPEADSIFRNCIMISEFSANADSASVFFCQGVVNGTFDFEFYNNTIVMTGGTGGTKTCVSLRDGCTATIDNCYLAIPSNSSRFTSFAQLSSTITTGSNNATTDLGSVPYSTDNFTNVTSGSEDLTPTSESALANGGTDLSSQGVTDDITGLSRPQGSAYEIGAVEIAQAAPATGDDVSLIIQKFSVASGALDPTNEGDAIATFEHFRATSLSWTFDVTITGSWTTVLIELEYSLDSGATWLTASDSVVAVTASGEVTGTATIKSTYARLVATTLTETSGTPTISIIGEILGT